MRILVVPAIVACLGLAACANPGQQGSAAPGEFGANKTTGGTLLGAAAGGLLGAQFGHGAGNLAATAAGTLLGGYLGNQAGASLDRADRAYAERAQTQAYAAPVGQTIRWNNPETGNSGTYVATRDGTASDGSYCREYQTTIVVGGQPQQGYGTACRQADGNWKVVK